MFFLYPECCTKFAPEVLTFNRVSGESQLADDVTRNISFHQMALFGMVLRCLQQMIKLLRIKLLKSYYPQIYTLYDFKMQ